MYSVNYTAELKNTNNYTDDVRRDTSKEKGWCSVCIYVGENRSVSEKPLCAESISNIAEVRNTGYCDKCKPRWFRLNQINSIKKSLLERSGFVLKNR